MHRPNVSSLNAAGDNDAVRNHGHWSVAGATYSRTRWSSGQLSPSLAMGIIPSLEALRLQNGLLAAEFGKVK